MVDYILKIDRMITLEFCKTYKIPIVKGDYDFMQVEAVKYRMFVEYATFLNQKLTLDMFEGDKRIFTTGRYENVQPSREWNYYHIGGKKIFQDSNTETNCSLGLKVSDLTRLGITYISK